MRQQILYRNTGRTFTDQLNIATISYSTYAVRNSLFLYLLVSIFVLVFKPPWIAVL